MSTFLTHSDTQQREPFETYMHNNLNLITLIVTNYFYAYIAFFFLLSVIFSFFTCKQILHSTLMIRQGVEFGPKFVFFCNV